MKIQNLPASVTSLNPMLKTTKSSKKPRLKSKKALSLSFSKHLQQLEALPNSTINAEEIESIKLAIKSGQFEVNTDAIAEALIESARELLAQR